MQKKVSGAVVRSYSDGMDKKYVGGWWVMDDGWWVIGDKMMYDIRYLVSSSIDDEAYVLWAWGFFNLFSQDVT